MSDNNLITLVHSRLNGCLSDSFWCRMDLTVNPLSKHSTTKAVFCGPWLTNIQREFRWNTIVSEVVVVSKYKRCWGGGWVASVGVVGAC